MDSRIATQFDARAPFPLADATLLVLAQIGSHSHGTHVPATDPDSIDDVDYMGVVIPPVAYVLGTERWDHLSFMHEELDVVFYSFEKFVSLLLKSNPNVLGLLWLDPEFYVAQDPGWDQFLEQRAAFSSKRAYSQFTGYARGQLHRMTSFDLQTQQQWSQALALITAAGWTKEQVIEGASRPMPNVQAALDCHYGNGSVDYEGEDYQTGLNPFLVGLKAALDAACASIKTIHAKHFQGYMGAKRNALVQRYGYDCKNACHMLRLTLMCTEFLETGRMQVLRTADAATLMAIKQGDWPLEQVKAEAAVQFARAERAYQASALPEEPDLLRINRLVIGTHLAAFGLHW